MQKDKTNSKVKTQKTLERVLERLKKSGKVVVFTNGCFDLLHPGHISYLKKAKNSGDILIVGLNSDNSVKKLKGKNRPLLPQQKRAEILASLEFVDFVTIFNEPTPLKLVKKLKPDILVKGADWQKKDIIGKDLVESYGAKVKRIPFLKGYSTSLLIKNICRKFSA